MTDPSLLAQFVSGLDESREAIVRRLAGVLDESPTPLGAAIKWKRLTYALDADFHHWICAIAPTKVSVGLVFHFGGLLDDPSGLFVAGESRFLRKLEYRSADEVDAAIVLGFVEQALGRLGYFKANWKAIQAGTVRPS